MKLLKALVSFPAGVFSSTSWHPCGISELENALTGKEAILRALVLIEILAPLIISVFVNVQYLPTLFLL